MDNVPGTTGYRAEAGNGEIRNRCHVDAHGLEEVNSNLKRTPLRQRLPFCQLYRKIRRQSLRRKPILHGAFKRHAAVPLSIHVCAHPDDLLCRDLNRSAAARKRLLADVTVQEHPSVEQLPFFVEHLPPISILLATRVGAGNRYGKCVGTCLASCCDGRYVG